MRSLFQNHVSDAPPPVEPVPTIFPAITGADIAAVFVGRRIAGDFYDSIRVSPERVLFGLLDVAGRREDNRAILTAAQEMFRTLGTKLFSTPDLNESDAMTELCLELNRGIINFSHEVRPCPAFIACYHEQLGILCYTNAGHTPGLLRDSRGVVELRATGLPLGLFSHATCDAPIVGIEKGASLLLVSRGVVECGSRNHDGDDEFGLARLKKFLETAPNATAQDLCSSVLKAAGEFHPGCPSDDDRTALAMIRTP